MRLSFRDPAIAARPLPPALTGEVPGTWAHDTMARRIAQEILPRILCDNEEELSAPTNATRAHTLCELQELARDLALGATGFLRGLRDDGPDVTEWEEILNSIPTEQRNWLQAPWAVAEFYFYRRVAECWAFFAAPFDMFRAQKQAGLTASLPSINQLAEGLPALLAREPVYTLEVAVLTSLWGNKMDLSLWPAEASSSRLPTNPLSGQTQCGDALHALRSFILDNHLEALVQHLQEGLGRERRADIVVDNAGYELVADLLLAHCLLACAAAGQVVLHVKAHPTFVSDATAEDVAVTLAFLTSSPNCATAALGSSLLTAQRAGRLVVAEDLFWCQPRAFWDMPPRIEMLLNGSAVTFVKGDANYRRLLGDRAWVLHEDPQALLSYWPVPVCALRTCKAELGCGLTEEAQQRAMAADPKFLISGTWAVIQFYNPPLPSPCSPSR